MWHKKILLLALIVVFASFVSADTLELNHNDVIWDTFVAQNQANSNYGDESTLNVRSWASLSNRVYVLFNITKIPANSEINDAYLKLNCTNYLSSATATNISIYGVTDLNWNDTSEMNVTYNTQPCGTSFDIADNCNLTAEDYEDTNDDNVNWEWNITNIVRWCYFEDYDNCSFALKVPQEGYGDSYGCEFVTQDEQKGFFINVSYNTTAAAVPDINITFSTLTPANNSNVSVNNFYINVSTNDTVSYCWAEFTPSNKINQITVEAANWFEFGTNWGGNASHGDFFLDTEHPIAGNIFTGGGTFNSTNRALANFNVEEIYDKTITNATFWWASSCETAEGEPWMNSSLMILQLFYNESYSISTARCSANALPCWRNTSERWGENIINYTSTSWVDTAYQWFSAPFTTQLQLEAQLKNQNASIWWSTNREDPPYSVGSSVAVGKDFNLPAHINYTLDQDNATMTLSGNSSNYNYTGLTNNTYYNFSVYCNDTSNNWFQSEQRTVLVYIFEEAQAAEVTPTETGTNRWITAFASIGSLFAIMFIVLYSYGIIKLVKGEQINLKVLSTATIMLLIVALAAIFAMIVLGVLLQNAV